jgi:uncharacterized membrane protein YtjA (UPF0391 family)
MLRLGHGLQIASLNHRIRKGGLMLRAALVFFVLGLVAIILGATGIAGISIDIGRTLLIAFLALAVISFLAGVLGGKTPRSLP